MATVLAVPIKGTVRLRYTNYNEHLLIEVADIKEYSLGHVLNSGDEAFKLVCRWFQREGSMELPVILMENSKTLDPGGRLEIRLKVAAPSEEYIGNYTGIVEVYAHYLNASEGKNPVVASTTFTANMTVKSKTVESFDEWAQMLQWLLLATVGCGLVALLWNIVEWKKQKAKTGRELR